MKTRNGEKLNENDKKDEKKEKQRRNTLTTPLKYRTSDEN